MSPWMDTDTRPDPVLARCGNCGQPWEAHEVTEEHGIRYCASGDEYRDETDEDRAADWAKAHGL